MTRIGFLATVALAFTAVLAQAPAYAQQPRTFVSPTGSDSNPCTLAAPCRTFQGAIAQTNSGGEIAVLGTAGYNAGATFNIDRPISIVNPGGFEAGIVVPLDGIGITFTTGGAVYLRGLTIEGGGTGSFGIVYSGVAGSLTIQQCVVRNLSGDGIDFEPNAAGSLTVSDTFVANNGNVGIVVAPSGSGAVTAAFNRIETDNNTFSGIEVEGSSSSGTLNVTVADSVAAGDGGIGFVATTTSGHASVNLMVTRSVAANDGQGIEASGPGATLWIGQSTVTGNEFGWSAVGGGVVQSYGTNQINGNTTDQSQIPAVTGGSN
jgi:hypothetical protein